MVVVVEVLVVAPGAVELVVDVEVVVVDDVLVVVGPPETNGKAPAVGAVSVPKSASQCTQSPTLHVIGVATVIEVGDRLAMATSALLPMRSRSATASG